MHPNLLEWVAVVGQKGLETDEDQTELHRAANEKQVCVESVRTRFW